MPYAKGRGEIYGNIRLMTVAKTQDIPSDVVGSFKKISSSTFGTVYYLNQDNKVPSSPTHMPQCKQEDQAYNEMVVLDSLHPLIIYPL